VFFECFAGGVPVPRPPTPTDVSAMAPTARVICDEEAMMQALGEQRLEQTGL
jgi:hypothetical protein